MKLTSGWERHRREEEKNTFLQSYTWRVGEALPVTVLREAPRKVGVWVGIREDFSVLIMIPTCRSKVSWIVFVRASRVEWRVGPTNGE